VTGDVIHPDVVLQVIDQSGVEALNQAAGPTCTVEGIRPYPLPRSGLLNGLVPIWVWPVIAVMAAVILFVCCCFLCGLVVERRRQRKRKRGGSDPYSQFNSQMSDYNAVSNPLWVAPYDNWEEER